MAVLPLIGIAVVMFISTNIDDIFILMLFFADRNYTPLQVVFGQYLGITLLLVVSIIIGFAALIFPAHLIGLLGFVPIALGIKELIELWRGDDDDDEAKQVSLSRTSRRWLTVCAVTVSNGADNIGVYVPLFATSTVGEITVITIVFSIMAALWCWLGYLLVKLPWIGDPLRRYGHRILPFVLIGLGLYILAEAYLFV